MPVTPRDTSIDHELRAHFVIGLIVELDDLPELTDANEKIGLRSPGFYSSYRSVR